MQHYKAKAQPMVRWVKDTTLHKILQWLEKNVRKPDAKERFWQLVATSLAGRTAAECQQRWRELHA